MPSTNVTAEGTGVQSMSKDSTAGKRAGGNANSPGRASDGFGLPGGPERRPAPRPNSGAPSSTGSGKGSPGGDGGPQRA